MDKILKSQRAKWVLSGIIVLAALVGAILFIRPIEDKTPKIQRIGAAACALAIPLGTSSRRWGYQAMDNALTWHGLNTAQTTLAFTIFN
jgi:hypothetical protein